MATILKPMALISLDAIPPTLPKPWTTTVASSGRLFMSLRALRMTIMQPRPVASGRPREPPGDIAFGSDKIDDFGDVAAGDLLQFGVGEDVGIADDSAFAPAERNIDHGALPGHPGGQRAHFVERDIGGEADAALGRPARYGVLYAVAGEDFDASIVELNRDVNGEFLGGSAQHLTHAVVELEPLGGIVKARGGGEPWVLFVLKGYGLWRC